MSKKEKKSYLCIQYLADKNTEMQLNDLSGVCIKLTVALFLNDIFIARHCWLIGLTNTNGYNQTLTVD